jgi:signal transduction histidine kinase
MSHEQHRSRASLRLAAQILGLAVLYTMAGKLGLMVGPVSGFATLVWAPSGIALVALVVLGRKLWPGVFAGALIVNLWTGAPPPAALGIAVGNTLEALIGALLLSRFVRLHHSLDRLRDVMGIVVFGALLSTIVSATIGVASLTAVGIVPPDLARFGETWRVWWLGDAIGDLVVAPFLLTWVVDRPHRRHESIRNPPLRSAAAIAIGVALLAVWWADGSVIRRPYLVFPVLIAAALRYRQRGATAATLAASAIAIAMTAAGKGPLTDQTLSQRLLELQAFVGITAITMLIMGAVIRERDRAAKMRENLLMFVSHDLKNPLHAITLNAAALERALQAGDPRKDERKRLAAIERSASQMNALIHDLLDSSAAEAGRLKLEVRDERISELIAESIDELRPVAESKLQTLQLTDPCATLVRCDRARVLQVLSNLISNAIKFSPPCSVISIHIAVLDGTARVSVTDRGIGMVPDQLSHVFERFWQGAKDVSPGTGLGLFIVRAVIEAHGGRIWVESTVGEGSTFHFTLPAVEPTAMDTGLSSAPMRAIVRLRGRQPSQPRSKPSRA